MDDKELKQLIQEDMLLDADRIMEKINSDPNLKDVVAPDSLKEKVFNKIREYEAQQEAERKSAEEKELIRLGKLYKRRRRWNKVAVLVAAIIAVLAISITGLGGPKRVLEEVKWILGGREQLNVDSDDERLLELNNVSEEDAYQEIEDVFNTYPVKAHYLPKGMNFAEVAVDKELQNARIFYDDGKDKMFSCTMWFDYRTVSTGMDVEDKVIREYEKVTADTAITIKEYDITDSNITRWKAFFKYEEVQYFLTMEGFTEDEMNETIDNLYFSK